MRFYALALGLWLGQAAVDAFSWGMSKQRGLPPGITFKRRH